MNINNFQEGNTFNFQQKQFQNQQIKNQTNSSESQFQQLHIKNETFSLNYEQTFYNQDSRNFFTGQTQYKKNRIFISFALTIILISVIYLIFFQLCNQQTNEVNRYKTEKGKIGFRSLVNKQNTNKYIPVQGKQYCIYTAINPVMVLDLSNKRSKNIVINQWKGSMTQKFYFKLVKDNKFKIYSLSQKKYNKKKVIKVQNQSRLQGTNLIFDYQKDQQDQLWELIPAQFDSQYSFYIKSFSGKSMNVYQAKGKNEQPVVQWNYEGWNTEIWVLWEVGIYQNLFVNQTKIKQSKKQSKQFYFDHQIYIFSAIHYNLVLDTKNLQQKQNKYLIINEWNALNSQLFYFRKAYESKVKIYCQGYKDRKVLRVVNHTKYSPGVIELGQQEDQNGQLWQLINVNQNNPNQFYIKSFYNLTLNIYQYKTQKGQRVDQYRHGKGRNQIWILKQKLKYEQQQKIYQQYLSNQFQLIKDDKYTFDSWIKFNRIKFEMQKNFLWLLPPILIQTPTIEQEDLPLQTQYLNSHQKQQSKQNSHQQMRKIKNQEIQQQIYQNYQQDEQQTKLQNGELLNEVELTSEQIQQDSQSFYVKDDDFQQNQTQIFHSIVDYPCTKNHKIAYVWFGKKQMPIDYKRIIQKCQNSSTILTDKDFQKYYKMWNQQEQQKITIQITPIRHQINMLKLLYLYFQSGIYADLDTQINQKCFENIYTDQIIFTNDNLIFNGVLLVPEQNFMMVRDKLNPYIKKMLEGQIKQLYGKGNRWSQCEKRQCLIVSCQRHYRDNTYKKGYD